MGHHAEIARFVLSAVFAFLCPLLSTAETQTTERPEDWPEGSAMHTGLLLVKERDKLDKQLADKHEELLKLLTAAPPGETSGTDPRLIAAIKSQEAAWLKYRTDECELVGTLTGAGGSWPSTYAVKCEVKLTKQRLRTMQSAAQCIKKSRPEDRLSEQNECLSQLAPIGGK